MGHKVKPIHITMKTSSILSQFFILFVATVAVTSFDTPEVPPEVSFLENFDSQKNAVKANPSGGFKFRPPWVTGSAKKDGDELILSIAAACDLNGDGVFNGNELLYCYYGFTKTRPPKNTRRLFLLSGTFRAALGTFFKAGMKVIKKAASKKRGTFDTAKVHLPVLDVKKAWRRIASSRQETHHGKSILRALAILPLGKRKEELQDFSTLHDDFQSFAQLKSEIDTRLLQQGELAVKTLRTRADLVKMAKERRLYGWTDLIVWASKTGVSVPNLYSKIQRILPNEDAKYAFAEELETDGYKTGAAFKVIDSNDPEETKVREGRQHTYSTWKVNNKIQHELKRVQTMVHNLDQQKDGTVNAEDAEHITTTLSQLEDKAAAVEAQTVKINEKLDKHPSSMRPTTKLYLNPSPPPACEDRSNFVDVNGNGCEWYAQGSERCNEFGADPGFSVGGMLAADSCCACGGGHQKSTEEKSAMVEERWGRYRRNYTRRRRHLTRRRRDANSSQNIIGYKVQDRCRSTCSKGTPVTSATECKVATRLAQGPQLRRRRFKSSFRYSGNYGTGYPKGCFHYYYGANSYFNTGTGGSSCSYSPMCKLNEIKVNGCPEVSAEEMAKRDQLTVQQDIIKCSEELGRTQAGVNTMHTIASYLVTINKIAKVVAKVSKILSKISTKVSSMLAGIPIIGQFAKVVDAVIKVVVVISRIVSKITGALAKVKKPIDKVKKAVDSAKSQVDTIKEKTDQFYDSLDQIFICKECVLRKAAQGAVEQFNNVILSGKNPMYYCHSRLKPINDGPMELWRKIQAALDKVNHLLDPLIAVVNKIVALVDKVANEVAKALREMKCCLPAIAQWIVNAASSILAVALCPLWGALDCLIKTMSDALTKAIFDLLKKIIPRVNFNLPGWGWHKSLNMKISPMPKCGLHAELNVAYNINFPGIAFDTNNILSVGEDQGSLSSLGNNMKNAIAKRCNDAFSSFKDTFKTCKCNVPVVGPVINVVNSVVSSVFSGWRL